MLFVYNSFGFFFFIPNGEGWIHSSPLQLKSMEVDVQCLVYNLIFDLNLQIQERGLSGSHKLSIFMMFAFDLLKIWTVIQHFHHPFCFIYLVPHQINLIRYVSKQC